MRVALSLALVVVLAGLGCGRPAAGGPKRSAAPPKGLDDLARLRQLEAEGQRLIEAGRTTPMAELLQQLGRTQCRLHLPDASGRPRTPSRIYEASCPGVLVVAGVHKCNRCPRWHAATASGFLLTSGGAFVTNYHVVNNPSHHTLVAMTHAGRVYPVKEVLAADEAEDVAILQLDAPGEAFTPIPLGRPAPVGAAVVVISHPDVQFYTLTAGVVSRYLARKRKEKEVTVLAITADFARGSSGGPVLDERGAAVGFVGSTRGAYYKVSEEKKEDLQMVFKHCVPADSIRKLISSDRSDP
jgi:S1-C subfamily serine protease